MSKRRDKREFSHYKQAFATKKMLSRKGWTEFVGKVKSPRLLPTRTKTQMKSNFVKILWFKNSGATSLRRRWRKR